MARPIILDVDAGVDDALAILLALASPEVEVIGITTVSGNVHVDKCTPNVLRILSFVEAEKRPPVFKGESAPLVKELYTAAAVHGEDGLGDLGDDYYPDLDWGLLSDKRAVEAMAEMVAGRPGEVTVVATGPLTNVARAIQEFPEKMAQAVEIVNMGGAVDAAGNIEPMYAAEFNTYVDPEALDVVLESGIAFTLVPTDATHGIGLMRSAAREWFVDKGGRAGQFAFDCCQFYMDFTQAQSGFDGTYMHDPMATAVVIDPSLMTAAPRRVYVEVREGLTRGMTVPYRLPGDKQPEPNCRVASRVEGERFIEMLLSRVGGLG